MNILLKTIKTKLLNIVEDIDNGNSNLTEDELVEITDFLQMYRKDAPMTKYQAYNYLHLSRASFDNLVASGKLPEGKKLYAGDSNVFWERKTIEEYAKNRKQLN